MPRASNAANALNALLGITEKVAEVQTRTTGRIVGVTEAEIQEFREGQGLIYYLLAPELFTPRVCANPDCGEPFLVSRKHVSYCSYSCINTSLNKMGLKFHKGNDLETLAQDPQVYNGNEPIWIRQPSLIKALETLQTLLEPFKQEDGTYKSIPSDPLKVGSVFKSQPQVKPSSQSDTTQTSRSNSSTPGKKPLKKPNSKRAITFG